jgi:hypothetical protein
MRIHILTFHVDTDTDPTLRRTILSLHASIVIVHGPSWLHLEVLQLLNFDFDGDLDPDPAFHSESGPNSKNDAIPASKHCSVPDPASKMTRIWIRLPKMTRIWIRLPKRTRILIRLPKLTRILIRLPK